MLHMNSVGFPDGNTQVWARSGGVNIHQISVDMGGVKWRIGK